MRRKELSGEPFKKSDYYLTLSERFGRTTKSFEYRMQNISYVYSIMGRQWVTGLKPASHIGSRVAEEIETLINKIEGQTVSTSAAFHALVDSLRKKNSLSKPESIEEPLKSVVETTQYQRSPEVTAWVLNEAKGVCENCGSPAPFIKEDDTPFLEVHHIKRLADGGSDSISNAIAICPNCHRELHYGKNKANLVKQVYGKNSRLIPE